MQEYLNIRISFMSFWEPQATPSFLTKFYCFNIQRGIFQSTKDLTLTLAQDRANLVLSNTLLNVQEIPFSAEIKVPEYLKLNSSMSFLDLDHALVQEGFLLINKILFRCHS